MRVKLTYASDFHKTIEREITKVEDIVNLINELDNHIVLDTVKDEPDLLVGYVYDYYLE